MDAKMPARDKNVNVFNADGVVAKDRYMTDNAEFIGVIPISYRNHPVFDRCDSA